MKFFHKSILLVLLILISAGVQSGRAQVAVDARVNTGKIIIGDHLKVWLEVGMPHQATGHLIWPSLPDSSLRGLEWISKSPIDTTKTRDSIFYRQELTLTAFDSGTYYIPSFPFILTTAKGMTRTIHTDSFLVLVQTVTVDTTRPFKPIKDVAAVQLSWWDYWEYFVGGLILLAIIAFVGYYFYQKRRARRADSASEKVPPEKAHDRALRLLKELDQRRLWQNGRVKEYYAALSYILRNYLDNRFKVKALELTTGELLKQMKKDRDLVPLRPLVKRVLQTSDLAKYAKAEPLPEEQEACRNAVLQTIEKTKMEEGEEGIS